jgi:NitT/TauT family transport system substrate-binding protein
VRFNDFSAMQEAFQGGDIQAAFILAPLAMRLREQNKPIRIVYLGHRDGTAMMVRTDSAIHDIKDLRGKTVAFPSTYSNQYLILFKALHERGMSIGDITACEMPPPDMPAALAAGKGLLGGQGVDAVIAGEPLMAKTELDGYGRVLFLTKQVWPEFISCVLAVRQDVIDNRRGEVQRLVDGIARSGLWLDEDRDTTQAHRMQAAEFVSRDYYNYDPKLLRFVLSKPPDRVKYTNLAVRRRDFEEIEKYAKMAGIFRGSVGFDDYADTSFVPPDGTMRPWKWENRR